MITMKAMLEAARGSPASTTSPPQPPRSATQRRASRGSGEVAELMDGEQHPGSEAHPHYEPEVHGLAPHEPRVGERQGAQYGRERGATETAQEHVHPGARRPSTLKRR